MPQNNCGVKVSLSTYERSPLFSKKIDSNPDKILLMIDSSGNA